MAFIPESIRCVTLNTGNILSLNDITKKPGQNPTEELSEAIKITLNKWQDSKEHARGQTLEISRRHDDLVDKMAAHERADLKVGIKLFVNSDSEKAVNEAIFNVFETLKIESIDNLVLSYNYKASETETDQKLEHLKTLWKALENFTEGRRILQIGLSDVEEATFRALYEWASVKPAIIQINLATCCVVPPSLQAFCKENEVQLLTHSDPSEILPKNSITEIFDDANLEVHWALRFLVHIKCRGVLTTKGYLLSLYRH